MKLLPLILTCAAMVTAEMSSQNTMSKETFDQVANMKVDAQGFTHIANDGVARSYSGDGKVIDFVKLSNNQLMSIIPSLAGSSAADKAMMEEAWKGVDGNTVQDMKQILQPSKELQPDFKSGAAEMGPSKDQSRNINRSILDSDSESQNYCLGKPCSTSSACYVLQQQSVRNIQAVLHPPETQKYQFTPESDPNSEPPVVLTGDVQGSDAKTGLEKRGDTYPAAPAGKVAKLFGKPAEGSTPQQAVLGPAEPNDEATKNKYAYLQLVSTPSVSSICSSLFLFKSLAANGTLSADSMFLYPKSWDTQPPTRSIALALNLLRDSNVSLYAIDPSESRDRHPSETRLLNKASSHLFRYERIFYLRSPGLLLDHDRLETTFRGHTSDSQIIDDSGEKIWHPTRFLLANTQLPEVFLVTSEISAAGVASVQPFRLNLDTQNELVAPAAHGSYQGKTTPAYVFFAMKDDRGRERSTPYYKTWEEGVNEVCSGIVIDN